MVLECSQVKKHLHCMGIRSSIEKKLKGMVIIGFVRRKGIKGKCLKMGWDRIEAFVIWL